MSIGTNQFRLEDFEPSLGSGVPDGHVIGKGENPKRGENLNTCKRERERENVRSMKR